VKTNAAIKVESVSDAESPRMLGLITLLGGKTHVAAHGAGAASP
jgi:hypothetical protein